MKKVSIIIPVFNTEDYIEECLESVLKQTYKNIEVIIVDDKSTDNTVNKIIKYMEKHQEINLFKLTKNKGVGGARNHGINQANGEFIYFLDSDDYLPPETIKLLVDNIGENQIIRGRMKTTYSANSFTIFYEGLISARYFSEKRFNLIKNFSATNFLIDKEFLIKNKIFFNEDKKIFSDLYFMIPILLKIEVIPYLNEAIYIRRTRDNPKFNISLRETDVEHYFSEMVSSVEELKVKYTDFLVTDFMDNSFLNYYRKKLVPYLTEKNHFEKIFSQLSRIVNLLSDETVKKQDFIVRREITAIIKNNYKKYRKIISQHQFLRDLKKGLKSKRNMHNFIYRHIFLKLSQKENLVVFESFGGKSYSDSPKYVYENMLEMKQNFNFIWAFNNPNESVPGKAKIVKRLNLKHYYYLARAKYWVASARMPNNLYKPDSKIYLQTWHGTPLKKLAGDMENVMMPGTNTVKYKRNFYNETKKWDYLISPNEYSTKIFNRAFWFENKILNTGYPRNDVLYKKNNHNDINVLKKKLQLPLSKKVILYAPTWRDDEYYSVGKYKFSLKLNLEEMQRRLGKDYVIILRLHYLIASEIELEDYKGFVHDFSSYQDISELYLISDLLITDYSSVFFDYANLKRPILFFTYDLEKYSNQLRGFYLDINKDLPGPLLTTSEEVLKSVEDINNIIKEYKQKYDLFYETYCNWDDGFASKRVIEEVFKE